MIKEGDLLVLNSECSSEPLNLWSLSATKNALVAPISVYQKSEIITLICIDPDNGTVISKFDKKVRYINVSIISSTHRTQKGWIHSRHIV